jgi:transposase
MTGHYGETTPSRRAVERDCPAAAARAAQAQGRPAAGAGPRLPDRHRLRPEIGHPLGAAAPGDGLRLRHDVLAAAARLAGGRGVGRAAPQAAGPARPGRPHRLEPGGGRLGPGPGKKGGAGTGPNPTDRGKPGTKHHLLTERQGIPLAALATAANVNDADVLVELVDRVAPVKRPRGRPRKRPAKLHADKASDARRVRAALRARGIVPRIARRGIESSERLGRHRWAVERTLAWLHRYRRLRVRDERRDDIHQAFLTLGCALICFNHLT